MALAWLGNIDELTLANDAFRTVVSTGKRQQLTLMRLAPGEDIGREAHPDTDQFIRIEEGRARVELGRSGDSVDESHEVEADWAILIPAGVWHNVVNRGPGEVRLYSIYSPPEHPDGTVHHTKAEADAAEHEQHG